MLQRREGKKDKEERRKGERNREEHRERKGVRGKGNERGRHTAVSFWEKKHFCF